MLVNDYVLHSNFNLLDTNVSQMGTGGLPMQFAFDIRLTKVSFFGRFLCGQVELNNI